MDQDLGALLDDWPYDEDANIRRIQGRDGGIVIRQGFQNVNMLSGKLLHRRPGAGGGQLQSQWLVTEGRHVEMTPGDSWLPGQG